MLLIQLSLPLPLLRSLHLRLQLALPFSLPLFAPLLCQILPLLRLLLLVTSAVAMLCILVVLRRRRRLLLLLLLCATPPIDDSKWLWLIRLPCFTSCCRPGQKGLHYTLLGTLDTFYFFFWHSKQRQISPFLSQTALDCDSFLLIFLLGVKDFLPRFPAGKSSVEQQKKLVLKREKVAN